MAQFRMFKRGRQTQIAIAFTCQLAFVLFGYDQGVFSELMKHPAPALEGIIVSIYNLGAFSGCILNFFIADYLGRRKAMWFAMAWIIVGAILQTTAFTRPHILVARYVTGIGTGIETSTVPMYQAELSEAHKRGRLVCSEPLFVGVGIVTAYFFQFGMSFVAEPVGISWRLPIACQMLFAILVIIMVFGVPESPRYCYQHGRRDEALQILCDVYDRPPEDPKIQREQAEIIEVLEMEQAIGQYKWRNILKRDRVQTGRRVLLAYGMQFMNQMGGINLVVYYAPTALQNNVGLTRELSLVIGGCVNVMFIIGSLLPTFTVDRTGRRKPMMWGSLGCAVSMALIAALLSFQGTTVSKATSSAAVTFFFTYMLIFGASANCIPWVYVPEILPLHARAKGMAVGISSNWLWNFFVVEITPVILSSLAWKAYLIFMCTNAAFIPLVYFCYPETANLTLEEVDYIFTDDTRGAVALSIEMRNERMKYGRSHSFSFSRAEPRTGAGRQVSLGQDTMVEKDNTIVGGSAGAGAGEDRKLQKGTVVDENGGSVEHREKL